VTLFAYDNLTVSDFVACTQLGQLGAPDCDVISECVTEFVVVP
jgi:hypothetical protein